MNWNIIVSLAIVCMMFGIVLILSSGWQSSTQNKKALFKPIVGPRYIPLSLDDSRGFIEMIPAKTKKIKLTL